MGGRRGSAKGERREFSRSLLGSRHLSAVSSMLGARNLDSRIVRRQDLAPRALSTPPLFQELTNDAEDKCPHNCFSRIDEKAGIWNNSLEQTVTSDTGGAHSPYKAGDGALFLITGFLCAGNASLQALVQRHVLGPDSLKFSNSRVASEFMYA